MSETPTGTTTVPEIDLSEQQRIRREKRTRLLESGTAAYPVSVDRTHALVDVREQWGHLETGQETDDVVSGLVKAAVFGFLISLMGCYQGYNSKGGAQGVGAATTLAVVSASILILAFDYVLTEMFFAQ